MVEKNDGSRKRATPTPGQPVRGSTTGRPIMALLDLLGRRWILRIVWELRDGPLTFRALRAAADGVSPSVLNQRLTDLRAAALVTRESRGYVLTPLGTDLIEALTPAFRWSERWAREMDGADR